MQSPVVGALLAFLGGCAIAGLNFGINARVLKKNPSALASISVVRQLLSVGYLAGVFFLSRILPWGYLPLLLGAALGLTVPAFLFALRLAKINDSLPREESDPAKKGADENE